MTLMEGLATVVLSIVAWEIIRFAAWRALRERWHRGVGEWMRRQGLHLEQFRFVDRVWVRQALLQDPVLNRAIAERAAELGVNPDEVRAKMEVWLDEIVPYFNLLSYYKLGKGIANWATNLAYELVFDKEALRAARQAIPQGAVTVYVANHRSNADYVVLSVGAMEQVALSYAVGEWARVWPLDTLFRSFGSYLIRRGEKDPLYHQVLQRYLQLVASRGLTTAFFPEGGLSRDGALRVPKLGLLDYLLGILRDDPAREIWFIPVGLNFDRVLEDRNLTAEATDAPPPRPLDKLRSLLRIARAAPRVLLAMFGPEWLRAHRKYGYAAVSFGKAVSAQTLDTNILDTVRLPRRERLAALAPLADALMDRVAAVVPATPVTLLARVVDEPSIERVELIRRVREQIASRRETGAPLAQGSAFELVQKAASAARDDDEATDRLGRDVHASEEAERTVDLALALLTRRGLAHRDGSVVRFDPADLHILRYYARSLDAPTNRAARPSA